MNTHDYGLKLQKMAQQFKVISLGFTSNPQDKKISDILFKHQMQSFALNSLLKETEGINPPLLFKNEHMELTDIVKELMVTNNKTMDFIRNEDTSRDKIEWINRQLNVSKLKADSIEWSIDNKLKDIR